MKRVKTLLIASLLTLFITSCEKEDNTADVTETEPTQEGLVMLAHCLTEKGWLMYGSITCSACRAQRKAFKDAFVHIREIECNPNIPGNQAELCLQQQIRKTPTWLQEREGQELGRLESYQLLEDLASSSDCDL